MQTKLLGIISVGFDITEQLLIRSFAGRRRFFLVALVLMMKRGPRLRAREEGLEALDVACLEGVKFSANLGELSSHHSRIRSTSAYHYHDGDVMVNSAR
jgi:hypothetical protein